MFKPLSWLMVLFVGAAFADAGSALRATSTIKPAPSPDGTQMRTLGRGGARNVENLSGNTQNSSRVATSVDSNKNVSNIANQSVASRNAVSVRSGTSDGNARTANEARGTNVTSNRIGVTARSKFTETGRRLTARGTNSASESENRVVSDRAASKTVTKESIAEAKDILEQTAELNKSCQDQYNECMDQFCAIVDSNQKRCSCSANLSKYKKVEQAVNDANTKLNEVAQAIRYIGLSADEIRAIMTATEAEEELAGTTDNTENRSMLEEIEKMIKDPTSATASYSGDSFGIDMNLDFSSESDIFSLDFLNTNTTSFSNLRGTELYNAAKSRCNTVLNQCKKAGATIQQVTGNYDLSIDKDCIAYENGLKKINETLVSNVRSAERMLQKARLAVLQNKNQYDAKGCIGALEACMTDDMVCGDNYAKCVDPTKRYIDENGNVVLGQNIASITEFMKVYDNTSIDAKFLESAYKGAQMGDDCAKHKNGEEAGGDGACTVKYLLQKIGTKQKVTDEGLCRAVLDKCQAYTYDGVEYKPYNDIVVNYIQRAMVNIKASQHRIISDYASSCMVDVAACYNQQVTQVNSWTSSASTNSIYNIMNGACRGVALTCGLAVFVGDPELTDSTEMTIGNTTYTVNSCSALTDAKDKCSKCQSGSACPDGCVGSCTSSSNKCVPTNAAQNSAVIQCVSEMFYQSLLCPDNSEFQPSGCEGTDECANARCKCVNGYTAKNGYCIVSSTE